MLHAAIGKARQHHQIVFWKRKRLREIAGEVFDSVRGNLLDLGRLPQGTIEFRLANIESGQAFYIMNFLEWPCSKGEKIGADRFRLREGRILSWRSGAGWPDLAGPAGRVSN